MKFRAEIDIMPHKELLDPQGKAVMHGLHNLHLDAIENVRVGKHITLHVTANNIEEATSQVEEACKKLLANAIMEGYEYQLFEA